MSYKWNEILILGDSFCFQRKTPNHWPYRLVNLLTGEDPGPTKPTRGAGFPGTSWWAVKKQLDFYLRGNPKVVIICHTEPLRLPNDRNKSINAISAMADHSDTPADSDLWHAAWHYYKFLLCEDFLYWAQYQWFAELEEKLLNTSSIEQVYHIQCFHGPWNKYPFKTGVTFNDNLFNYHHIDTETEKYANHLSAADNHRLAQQMAELIKNYPGDGHVVKQFNLKDKYND